MSKIEGGTTTNYVRDGVGVTAPVIRDTFASYTPGTSEKRGATTTFLHSGLKNAEMQTDSSKAVSATKQYDAFGNLTTSTGAWQGAFGYAGGFGYQEDASGLKLLGHRYYDSSTGRFLTRDRIKQGRNWFTYCNSDPISQADPDGYLAEQVGGVVGGMVGAAVVGAVIVASGAAIVPIIGVVAVIGAVFIWDTTQIGKIIGAKIDGTKYEPDNSELLKDLGLAILPAAGWAKMHPLLVALADALGIFDDISDIINGIDEYFREAAAAASADDVSPGTGGGSTGGGAGGSSGGGSSTGSGGSGGSGSTGGGIPGFSWIEGNGGNLVVGGTGPRR